MEMEEVSGGMERMRAGGWACFTMVIMATSDDNNGNNKSKDVKAN
jgi:hypothetical protein